MRETAINNKTHRQHVTRAFQRRAGSDRQWRPERCADVDTAQRLAAMQSLLSLLEQGVIAEVGDMLRHWQCCLLLADRDGVIVKRWGDAQLMPAAQGDWLMPGANWNEAHSGCNAIGTCLVERGAIDVIAGEHACEQMQHLAGFAVPLKTPHGIIDGCLALISDPYRDRTHRHSGLLQVLSMQIENRRLINFYRHDHYRLTFNSSRDNLDSPRSGLLIFDALGRLAASNTRARWLLGLDSEHDRGRRFESLCDARWQETISSVESGLTLRFAGRYHCHCRLESPPSRGSRAAAASPLQRLDLGDPRLHQSIMLASRLKDRGIAMLIHGETGTGKEVFVKALHAASQRAEQPLVAINCAAIPGDLVEAELFGYVRGAFTGADPRGNIGRLREANGGRLFLDEIGDMPLGVQARLLRVLQERRVTPLGGGESYPVDIEVIAATHRPLAQEIAAGRFRADLYYRLAGVELMLPPLREREDIHALIHVVLTNQVNAEQAAGEQGAGIIPTPTPELMDWLVRQPWPGNIREMENVLRVSLAMADGPTLALHHLPANLLVADVVPSFAPSFPPISGVSSLHPTPTMAPLSTSNASLKERLAEHRGNRSALARELGISRTTLYKRLREQSEALSS
ncbi:Transcriptional regulator of acetoin/glycerol metabolism [Modicisalibacter muralis]|uniref:Transcriptional regulator of acetoin/glycerol metabolism n=1 Tax=Modicisalibacter muralis TaxID=119000 RepID=A0A1G9PTF3_9GAMM|nr:sigma-54-dependent Fis family transcriptional regulator [Halomonas muralis]SDM02072.1 Transcriptional regulator of acetoin/glycerol metabolism [Halomonas muralis]